MINKIFSFFGNSIKEQTPQFITKELIEKETQNIKESLTELEKNIKENVKPINFKELKEYDYSEEIKDIITKFDNITSEKKTYLLDKIKELDDKIDEYFKLSDSKKINININLIDTLMNDQIIHINNLRTTINLMMDEFKNEIPTQTNLLNDLIIEVKDNEINEIEYEQIFDTQSKKLNNYHKNLNEINIKLEKNKEELKDLELKIKTQSQELESTKNDLISKNNEFESKKIQYENEIKEIETKIKTNIKTYLQSVYEFIRDHPVLSGVSGLFSVGTLATIAGFIIDKIMQYMKENKTDKKIIKRLHKHTGISKDTLKKIYDKVKHSVTKNIKEQIDKHKHK